MSRNTFQDFSYYFHNNVCHVCQGTENLLRCSQCKTVAYCSKKHQKEDWKVHRDFCVAMNSARASTRFEKPNTFQDFVNIKKMRYEKLLNTLERELRSFEMQMWMFPRYCEVCFSENVTVECDSCRSSFFCSGNHKNEFKEQHEKHCDELKLHLDIALIHCRSMRIDTKFIVSDISDNIKELPKTILHLHKLYDKNINSNSLLDYKKITCLSPAASMLYGLEKCGLIKNRHYHKPELTVHIVGADISEMCLLWKEMIELVFHWITNLTNLEYFIVGPELNHDGSTKDKFTKQLCSTCNTRNVKSICTFHSQLYHNIVNHIKQPDVVIAFNSGLHENSTKQQFSSENYLPEHMWEDSIPYLTKHKNVPLILTAYTFKELLDDIEEVKKYSKGIKVLVEPQKNPFCDIEPRRDFESNTEPLFYVNGFIAVLTV